jgi:hypothetical protein
MAKSSCSGLQIPTRATSKQYSHYIHVPHLYCRGFYDKDVAGVSLKVAIRQQSVISILRACQGKLCARQTPKSILLPDGGRAREFSWTLKHLVMDDPRRLRIL